MTALTSRSKRSISKNIRQNYIFQIEKTFVEGLMLMFVTRIKQAQCQVRHFLPNHAFELGGKVRGTMDRMKTGMNWNMTQKTNHCYWM